MTASCSCVIPSLAKSLQPLRLNSKCNQTATWNIHSVTYTSLTTE